MYPVSEHYKEAIKKNSRSFYYAGTITTLAGMVYEFENKDIVKGSGYIVNQSCSEGEMSIGNAYAAELGITLYSKLDRYTLEGAEVRLSFFLEVAFGEYEEVPLGVFEICEANVTRNCVAIKAYDYMLRFDKACGRRSVINGTAFDLLSLACEKCGVVLHHTKEEMELWENATTVMSLYPENDVETWRDVIYYVAQLLGCFATMNRYGELELRKYGRTPVMTVTSRQRYSSSFSDFAVKYTAIRAVNQKTDVSEYYALEEDDGLTMTLGSNPFLQYMVDEQKKQMLENILQAVSQIDYIPYEVVTIGNPALELGDVLVFTDGQADSEKLHCLTYMHLDINGRQKLKGAGKNTQIANSKSRSDKNITGLLNQIESSTTVAQSYINASEYAVLDALTKIISIDVVTAEDTFVQFHATILTEIEAESSAVVELLYELNGISITGHQPMQTVIAGHHVITLFFPFDELAANTVNEIRISMRVTGGSAKIARNGIVAAVYGHGIVVSGEAEWDGTINVSDYIRVMSGGFAGVPVVGNVFSGMQVEQIYPSADRIPMGHTGFDIVRVEGEVTERSLRDDERGGLREQMRACSIGYGMVSWSARCGVEQEVEE